MCGYDLNFQPKLVAKNKKNNKKNNFFSNIGKIDA